MTYWNNKPHWNGELETLEDHDRFFAWLEAHYEPPEEMPGDVSNRDGTPDQKPVQKSRW